MSKMTDVNDWFVQKCRTEGLRIENNDLMESAQAECINGVFARLVDSSEPNTRLAIQRLMSMPDVREASYMIANMMGIAMYSAARGWLDELAGVVGGVVKPTSPAVPVTSMGLASEVRATLHVVASVVDRAAVAIADGRARDETLQLLRNVASGLRTLARGETIKEETNGNSNAA